MSIHAVAQVKKMHIAPDGTKLNAADKAVMFVIADYCDPNTGVAFPNLTTLAQDAGLSKGALCKVLNRLEAAGVIEREQRRQGQRAGSTLYRLPWLPPEEHKYSLSPSATKPSSGSPTATVTEASESPTATVTESSVSPSARLSVAQGDSNRKLTQEYVKALPPTSVKPAPPPKAKASTATQERIAKLHDLLAEREIRYSPVPRDYKAVKDHPTVTPDEMADALEAVIAGRWGDDYLRKNLSLFLILPRINGYRAVKQGTVPSRASPLPGRGIDRPSDQAAVRRITEMSRNRTLRGANP